MPREARKVSTNGIQHLVVQGRHGLDLFHRDEDKKKYLSIVTRLCQERGVKLYAYCIMDNHLHMVMQEGRKESGSDISSLIRCAHAEFSVYFRRKHPEEEGLEIFRDRFRSQLLEGEQQLLQTVRFIHQEPVRNKIALSMEEYPWSSYRLYKLRQFQRKDMGGLDTMTITDMLCYSGGFEKYMAAKAMKEDTDFILREVSETYGISDEEAISLFEKHMNGGKISDLKKYREQDKRDLIRLVRKEERISILQLCRITGVSRGVIQRL